jgi:hypothetical protein
MIDTSEISNIANTLGLDVFEELFEPYLGKKLTMAEIMEVMNILNHNNHNANNTKFINVNEALLNKLFATNVEGMNLQLFADGTISKFKKLKTGTELVNALNKVLNSNNLKTLSKNKAQITDIITILSSLSIEQIDMIIDQSADIIETELGKFVKTAMGIYQNGLKMASQALDGKNAGLYKEFFENFRDHGFKHALAVTQYAINLSNGLNLSQHEINLMTIAALSHDFGMQGGYVYLGASEIGKIKKQMKKELGKSDSEIEQFLKDNNISEKTAMSLAALEEILVKTDPKDPNKKPIFKKKDFVQNFVRGMHPLNSALDILSIADFIPSELQQYVENLVKENGLAIDTTNLAQNVAALLAMTHSKSTSGITLFSIKSQWMECIHRMEVAAKARGVNINSDALRASELIFTMM